MRLGQGSSALRVLLASLVLRNLRPASGSCTYIMHGRMHQCDNSREKECEERGCLPKTLRPAPSSPVSAFPPFPAGRIAPFPLASRLRCLFILPRLPFRRSAGPFHGVYCLFACHRTNGNSITKQRAYRETDRIALGETSERTSRRVPAVGISVLSTNKRLSATYA